MKATHLLALFFLFSSYWVQASERFKVSTVANAELLPDVISVVKEAYALLNIELDISLLPAQRALLEAEKSDIYDAELARVRLAEAQLTNFVRIPVKLKNLKLVLLTNNKIKNLGGLSALQQLNRYKVASLRGIVLTDKLLQKIDNHLIDNTRQGFEMLKLGRIDVLAVPFVMTKELDTYWREGDIIIQDPPLFREDIYHFVHTKHIDLIPKITEALSAATGNPIEAH